MAYKPNLDDTRGSIALQVAAELIRAGLNVVYHDPHVPTLCIDGVQLQSQPLDAALLERAACVAKPEKATNEWLDWYRVFQRKRRERLVELGAEPVDEDFNIGRACAATSKWWAYFKDLPTTDTSDKCCDLMLALFEAYLADDWGAGATPAMYPFAAFAKDDYWQRLARGLVYE